MSKNSPFTYPDGFSSDVLNFIDAQHRNARENMELPTVRNKHEAYGIMAEKAVIVASGASGVNKALKDALNALPNSSEGFVSACEMAYNACIDTAMAAVDMAVAMQNVVAQISMYAGQTAGTTPLETMAAETIDDDFASLDAEEADE